MKLNLAIELLFLSTTALASPAAEPAALEKRTVFKCQSSQLASCCSDYKGQFLFVNGWGTCEGASRVGTPDKDTYDCYNSFVPQCCYAGLEQAGVKLCGTPTA